MKLLAALVLSLLLTGCMTSCQPQQQLVEVLVPVPVACDEEEPARPALAIDTMPEGLAVDEQARHMRADHTLRDGYEGGLRAALKACKTTGDRAPP